MKKLDCHFFVTINEQDRAIWLCYHQNTLTGAYLTMKGNLVYPDRCTCTSWQLIVLSINEKNVCHVTWERVYGTSIPRTLWEEAVAEYNRSQISTALAETDPGYSNYLDLETGEVIRLNDTDESPETSEVRDQIMNGYGDRFRYIPGGNASPDDSAVQSWLEAEGL